MCFSFWSELKNYKQGCYNGFSQTFLQHSEVWRSGSLCKTQTWKKSSFSCLLSVTKLQRSSTAQLKSIFNKFLLFYFTPPLWPSEVPCFGAPYPNRQTPLRRRRRRRPSRWWRMSLYVWTDTTAAPRVCRSVEPVLHRRFLEGRRRH